MEVRLPPRWTTVEAFAEPSPSGWFTRLDAVVRDAGVHARRWRSTAGGRALLIPADGPLPVSGLPDATTGLLFVDPATAESIGPLLAAVRQEGVRVALPEDTAGDLPGLAAEAGRVTLGDDTTWRLYRPVPVAGPWSAPGPEASVLSPRERWFGSRHGGDGR
jgi:hypothetical protein